jgi:PTS system N-acetylglucosamine-specific IIC component
MLKVIDMQYIQYIIIVIILLIAALVIIKANKKDFHIEANKLIEYLGGKDNIISVEVNMSRFKATLKDISIVNKDAIQKLGARGIVEIDNQLKIILGVEAHRLKKYIEDLKKANVVH